MKRRTRLSSKASGPGKQAGAEKFPYPPAPSGAALDSASAGSATRWAARLNAPPRDDAAAAAAREQQSWLKGIEAGKAQSRAEYDERSTKLREEIDRALQEFAAERETYFHRVEEQLVRLTLAIAR